MEPNLIPHKTTGLFSNFTHVPQDFLISLGILDSTHIKQHDEVLIFGWSEFKMIEQNLAYLTYSYCHPFRYKGLGHEHFLLYTF